MNQNIFSLLPDYDGDDPLFDAVEVAKQPPAQPRSGGSKSGDSKVQSQGTNIKQTSNGVSNGSQPRNRSYQGNNRGADQAQRTDGVIVCGDSYRRNQYPRNSNGGNGYQRNNGGDSVANRPGENRRVYVQRGSNNGEETRYSKNSNGAGINRPFRSQGHQRQQHGGERIGNGAQQQNQQPAESESKSAEVNNAGDDNNDWKVVASRRKVNVPMSNGHGVDRRSNNWGNGQYTARRRASGQYVDNRSSYANSEASNNNESKDDLVVVAANAGNEDSSNAKTTEEDSTVPVVEEKLMPKVEKKPSIEDEERLRWLAEKKKEREEDAKLKTFKDYQNELREKNVNQTPRGRVAALYKELESMQLVGKRKDLLLPLVGEAGSESVVSEAETDTKSEKDELLKKEKESVCKSIVEVFMKPTSFRNSRPPVETSNGKVKGIATSSRRVKDNAGLESTPKGNTSDPLVKEKIETVKRKEAEISMNLTDNHQFPAL